MSRNNRKKLFNAIQLTYLSLGITTSVLGVSSYLAYIRPTPTCAFCIALCLLLVLLIGLSLGSLFIPAHRHIIYPAQLLFNLSGLLFSLRQLYFEQAVNRFPACPKPSSNALKTVFNWLYAGAPACQQTPLLGPLTLATWSCLVFGILLLITAQLYLNQIRRR